MACTKTEDNHPEHQQNGYYTCSMHPQIMENKPGKCPICGMDLVKVEKTEQTAPNEITLNDTQIQLANIQVQKLDHNALGDQFTLTGILNFDQSKMSNISSKVGGRLEKLFFKSIGDYIAKGAPVASIYSEELNNAKQEYILALQRKMAFQGQSTIDFEQLIRSAKNKLLLWGMSEGQINELSRTKKTSPLTTVYSSASGYITSIEAVEGDYVMEGGSIFNLADLSSIWAEAQVYTSQMAKINPAGKVSVQIPDLDNLSVTGHVILVNPDIDPNSRINLVRVEIPNIDGVLKPSLPAYIKFQNPLKNALYLPTDAVIQDSKGATVWVKTGDKKFAMRMVTIGIQIGDNIEIVKGLLPGDMVVTKGAYLLNSEFVFKKGADPMAGHDMTNM